MAYAEYHTNRLTILLLKSLHSLRKDRSCMVLTAPEGNALVIIDKNMYTEKCMALRNEDEVYHECRNQTKSIHSKVFKQLLALKISIGPSLRDQYINLHLAGNNSPLVRFYSLRIIHKANISFRPIVSACGTSTYKVTKFLTKILQWYCGNNFSFVKDNRRLAKSK